MLHGNRDNLVVTLSAVCSQLIEDRQTPKDFVAPFPAQNHLNTHSLDLPAQQIHRCTRPDRRNIVGLEMINDIGDRIQTLLNGEDVFVVNCLEEMCGFPGCE